AHGVEDAGQVERDDVVPHRRIEAIERHALDEVADVVDEDVDAASQSRYGFLHAAVDLCRLEEIAFDHYALASPFADQGGGLLGFDRALGVVNRDVRARLCEHGGDAATDSGARSRHDCALVGKVDRVHRRSPQVHGRLNTSADKRAGEMTCNGPLR